jgi:putative transposase
MPITHVTFSVSRESVRKIALGVDRYQVMQKRFGRQAADAKLKPRGAGVITTRPLERVEVDHFLCDVHLNCAKTGVRLGRPWLTLLVDTDSGMILGYFLSFAPPSAASVLAALRHAILPKGADWPAFGIPDLLVVDNGLDLTSHGVREACIALAIDLLFTPPRAPWYKGTIERVGRTTGTRFIHWLPGTTLGRATSDLGYNGAEHAEFDIEFFEALLVQYFTTIHNKTPRRAKEGTPERRFLAGCQMWPVRVPTSQADFDAAVALTRTAVLRQTGLHFLDLQYQNEVLGQMFNRSPASTRLTIKVNPLNLQTIQVRHPVTGDYFPADCVSNQEWPRSLSFHMAVRAYAKENGLNTQEKSALARAQRDLMAQISEAAATSKRQLRRKQAEMFRQGQSMESSDAAEMPSPNEPDNVIDDVFDRVYSRPMP